MLRSYIAGAIRGQVILSREVLAELGIGPDCILYGTLCPWENTAVLSPLPPSCWDAAYKVIVHTKEAPGSLAAAARAIAELGLSITASWASNESHYSHLACTFLVVAEHSLLKKLGGPSGVESALLSALRDSLSALVPYRSGTLSAVRVTPLAFLSMYSRHLRDAEFYTVPVVGHNLLMNGQLADADSHRATSLWGRLCVAVDCDNAAACILSCDTEEALLRIALVPGAARLCQVALQLSVESPRGNFSGYWQRALDRFAWEQYCVFTAQNILIEKAETPPTERMEFRFVVDREGSSDKGLALEELAAKWRQRFQEAFDALASERRDVAHMGPLRVTRPRGVGVPCFVATNAKPGTIGALAATEICRMLEGFGFKPVNVDLASGGGGLRTQVRDLVRACRFMVVLYCPEERLARGDGMHGVSEWVTFEEGLMEAAGGEVIRLRFENVTAPAYGTGFVEVVIAATGLDPSVRDNIERRLERWQPRMHRLSGESIDAPEVPVEVLERDLVAYYGSRR